VKPAVIALFTCLLCATESSSQTLESDERARLAPVGALMSLKSEILIGTTLHAFRDSLMRAHSTIDVHLERLLEVPVRVVIEVAFRCYVTGSTRWELLELNLD